MIANFCWLLALLGSVIAGLTAAFTLWQSTNTPPSAAGYAMAVAWAAIPYVFARAVDRLSKMNP